MTRFILLRHGETEWNHDGNRYCGWSDVPLSEAGREQAKLAADVLREVPVAAAYCSTLRRAIETVEIIGAGHSFSIESDQRIREMHFGEWEGLTKSEIESKDSQLWAEWLRNPTEVQAGITGETAFEVYQRANQFFMEKSRQHPDQNVLVVGHNTFNRIFISGSLHVPFRNYRRFIQSNTGITIIDIKGDDFILVQLNETAHLRPNRLSPLE